MDEPWESGSGLGQAAAARRHGPTGGPHHVSTSRAPVLSIAGQPSGVVIEQGLFTTKSPTLLSARHSTDFSWFLGMVRQVFASNVLSNYSLQIRYHRCPGRPQGRVRVSQTV